MYQIILIMVLALCVIWPAQAATAAATTVAADSTNEEMVRPEHVVLTWRLNQTEMSSSDMLRSRYGFLVPDYKVTGQAMSDTPDNPLPQGRFEFQGSVFSPLRDMPGQRAGQWYLQGKWQIVATDADPQILRIRHNPYRIEGTLRAELPANPADRPDLAVDALLTIASSLAGGRWNTGSGKVVGNGALEGELQLHVDRHPDMNRRQAQAGGSPANTRRQIPINERSSTTNEVTQP